MATFILIIFSIATLILVHEWGHFYSARKLGVSVEEFGFGFPPRLLSRTRNGIRYSLNLFPFGGFVKIFGEHGEGDGNPQSFVSRPPGQRFIIIVAGIIMNFILAWLLFSVASVLGVPKLDTNRNSATPVSVISVEPSSPAENAGLRFGDKILEMRMLNTSLRIESEQDVINFVEAYKGEGITLVIERGNNILELHATPRAFATEGQGPLGVMLARLTLQKASWYLAPAEGGRMFIQSLLATLQGLWLLLKELITSGQAPTAVSGPIGIFSLARDTRSLGFSYFLQFIGILSVNLGFLNFLPIPALDGGRIFFILVEKIKGSRIRPALENTAHTIGFVLLIILIILVTYRDLHRIF